MYNIDRLDILQEMVNIGFGRSSAAIAELLDAFVTMSVPRISDISASGVHHYLLNEIGSLEKVTIVRQIFRGDFSGETVMVFPDDSILNGLMPDVTSAPDWQIEEIFLEVGNIIVGACLGKIAELLHTVLSYSVPQFILKKSPISQLCSHHLGKQNHILVIENTLCIGEKKTNIYLFIIVSPESMSWLYQTLDKEIKLLMTGNAL